MKRVILSGAGALIGCTLIGVAGCASPASDLKVEKLPDVTASLPSVPTLPPPPHPVKWEDGSYSVYGVRKHGNTTMDTDVEVSGYLVEIYVAPECPEGALCKPNAAPHAWLADVAGETDKSKRIAIVGYAENQKAIDEAVAQAKRGAYKPPPAESGLLPIPVDFAVGNKIKVQGRFTRVSGSGFNISNGLLEYRSHTTTTPAAQ